jgi:hypothetical protein
MIDIRQKINSKILAKFFKLPDELKDKDLEVIIKPVTKRRKKFAKIYSTPIKVRNIRIPSRSERNER